jgi:hypothetical protein
MDPWLLQLLGWAALLFVGVSLAVVAVVRDLASRQSADTAAHWYGQGEFPGLASYQEELVETGRPEPD